MNGHLFLNENGLYDSMNQCSISNWTLPPRSMFESKFKMNEPWLSKHLNNVDYESRTSGLGIHHESKINRLENKN